MAFGDAILNMIKKVREREPVRRTLCPECEYPVDEKDNGTLFCVYCGWRSR